MKINVNPETQASADFGYAAEGEYKLRVVSCEWKKGKAFPYLEWKFEFADPNVKATDTTKKLGNIFENTTLKEESQFGVRNITDALGLAWGDLDTDEVKGMELTAKVGIEEYDGKMKNVVKKFIKA